MFKCNNTGIRTEINKKRGRPSDRSEEARAKQGNNSWGVGGAEPLAGSGALLRFVIVKNAISLQEMQDIPDIPPSILLHKYTNWAI